MKLIKNIYIKALSYLKQNKYAIICELCFLFILLAVAVSILISRNNERKTAYQNQELKKELINLKIAHYDQSQELAMQNKINDLKEKTRENSDKEQMEHGKSQDKIAEDLKNYNDSHKTLGDTKKDTEKVDTLSNANINALWSSYCIANSKAPTCKDNK